MPVWDSTNQVFLTLILFYQPYSALVEFSFNLSSLRNNSYIYSFFRLPLANRRYIKNTGLRSTVAWAIGSLAQIKVPLHVQELDSS